MKYFLSTVICMCMLVLSACDNTQQNSKQALLDKYQDKWIILNYWASWCKPCYTEIPELNKLYVDNKDTLIVLGVNFDQMSKQQMADFAKQYDVQYPLLEENPGKALGIDKINVLPATYVISPKGELSKALYGPQTGEAILAEITKGENT